MVGRWIFAGGGAESPSSSTGIGGTTGAVFGFEEKKRPEKTGGGSRPTREMLFRVWMKGGVSDGEGKLDASVRAFVTGSGPVGCGTSLDVGEDVPCDAAVVTTGRDGIGLGASMIGSDIARDGVSTYGNMGPCRGVSEAAFEVERKACNDPSVGADKAVDGGGSGAIRVGLGGDTGDEDGDGGCGNVEARGDGPEAPAGAIVLGTGNAVSFSIEKFATKTAGNFVDVLTSLSAACDFAARGTSVPGLLESRLDWRFSECDRRFSFEVVRRGPVGTCGRAVVGGGNGEVELAGEGAGEREGVVDRSLDLDEVDARLDARRSVGMGGNGQVGGGAGGSCDKGLVVGNGGTATFGGVVVGGSNDVRFEEFVLSGNGGRGTFGGG